MAIQPIMYTGTYFVIIIIFTKIKYAGITCSYRVAPKCKDLSQDTFSNGFVSYFVF